MMRDMRFKQGWGAGEEHMNVTLRVWHQARSQNKGRMVAEGVEDISSDISFLEVVDVLDERLTLSDVDPIAFDHDCREDICFNDGDVIDVEPWRAQPLPVIKDLVVDRSSFDRMIQAGGYFSVPTGSAPDANTVLVSKTRNEDAFDAAVCIGCGACVAACPNRSAMLFAGAKITHLGMLPQGQPERNFRALSLIAQDDHEGFGACTQIGECVAVCPKGIQLDVISRFDHDVLSALLHGDR
jgi:succinate dehydrogenase / fumarate reductase iron-sulfur subunit